MTSQESSSNLGALFLDRAAEGGLLFDGAVGTQLYERGIFLNQCFEQVSITQPRLIKQVHRDYFEAGGRGSHHKYFWCQSDAPCPTWLRKYVEGDQ